MSCQSFKLKMSHNLKPWPLPYPQTSSSKFCVEHSDIFFGNQITILESLAALATAYHLSVPRPMNPGFIKSSHSSLSCSLIVAIIIQEFITFYLNYCSDVLICSNSFLNHLLYLPLPQLFKFSIQLPRTS